MINCVGNLCNFKAIATDKIIINFLAVMQSLFYKIKDMALYTK